MFRLSITLAPGALTGFDAFVRQELARQAAPRLRAAAVTVRQHVGVVLGAGLRATPHYLEILSGSLRTDFGLADPSAALVSVEGSIADAIRVDVLPAERDTLGGLTVGVFRADLSDALDAAGAQYVSDAVLTSKPVPWLKWLLTEGDRVVLADYALVSLPEFSRTNKSVMVERTGWKKRLAPFRVRPAYSGTPDNNWLTQAADVAAPQVAALVERALRAELS